MGALSADRNTLFAEPEIESYPVAANAVIYKGSLVMINSGGYAIPGADTASCVFVGVSQEKIVNTGGGNGAKNVKVRRMGIYKFAYGGSVAITLIGVMVYLVDDQTVNAAASTTNDIPCGKITQVDVSGGQVWIDIGLAWV